MLTNDERNALIKAAEALAAYAEHELREGNSHIAPINKDLAAKLRAIAAPRHSTVGELLATAPVIEICTIFGWMQMRADGEQRAWLPISGWGRWGGSYAHDFHGVAGVANTPAARLVPADQADADPSTREDHLLINHAHGLLAKPEGGADLVPLPILPDVPVMFFGGGGMTITAPIKPGDECLVIFADRCIDGWWWLGGVHKARLRQSKLWLKRLRGKTHPSPMCLA